MGRVVVSVKLTRDEVRMLEDLSLRLGVSKSEVIRRGLYVLYDIYISTQSPENKLPESSEQVSDTATVSQEPVPALRELSISSVEPASSNAYTSASATPRIGKRFIEINVERKGEEEWFST